MTPEQQRLAAEAQLRQQQVQAQLEAELARQQADWANMQGKLYTQGVYGARGFQGKSATVTVIDDPSDPNFWKNEEYDNVAKHIRNALARIITVQRDMEKMRDWRYTSPWHPKRWRRWLQKRKKPILDTLIFGPLALVALGFVGYGYWKLGQVTDYYVSTLVFWLPIAVVYGVYRKTALK